LNLLIVFCLLMQAIERSAMSVCAAAAKGVALVLSRAELVALLVLSAIAFVL
jgi:hypothetical protein